MAIGVYVEAGDLSINHGYSICYLMLLHFAPYSGMMMDVYIILLTYLYYLSWVNHIHFGYLFISGAKE